MSRRRKRKKPTLNESLPNTLLQPSEIPESPSLVPADTGYTVQFASQPFGVLTALIEKAAERAKNSLAATGKISPMVFFAYGNETLKGLSFSFNNEHSKHALIERIREKAVTENASAVILLTEKKPGPNGEISLVGAGPGATVSARVKYSYDEKARILASWELSWLDQSVQSIFLDGIFSKTS